MITKPWVSFFFVFFIVARRKMGSYWVLGSGWVERRSGG